MQPETKLELELGPIAPWHTMIRVRARSTYHGRQSTLPHDWLFDVEAEWYGPPMTGMPPALGPVQSHDVYTVNSLEHARALARRAADEFAKGGDEPPDLRELAGPE